jgi:hypothetical protein
MNCCAPYWYPLPSANCRLPTAFEGSSNWRDSLPLLRPGTGVICETWALEAAVIPAKAGIYSAKLRKCTVDGLDSRFRGNDRRFEGDPIPNDTTTRSPRQDVILAGKEETSVTSKMTDQCGYIYENKGQLWKIKG